MAAITTRLEEARKAVRHRTFLGAILARGQDMLTVDCVVRDWSDTGAKVQLTSDVLVPDDVWLVEPRMSVAYEARVVWRRLPLVGLSFVQQHRLDGATDPRLRILRRLWTERLPR